MCYDKKNEVTTLENLEQEYDEQGYVPRPAWQVWAARVGLVLFILLVIWQLVRVANGWL